MRQYTKADLRQVATITKQARTVDIEEDETLLIKYYSLDKELLMRSILHKATGVWAHSVPIPEMKGV